MNVLYFHQHFSTPMGATGIRSYEMARQLIDAGHSVTMVCGSYRGGSTGLNGEFVKGRRSGVVEGIQVIEFELEYSNSTTFIKRIFLFLLFALRSVKVALSHNYDLLFSTSTPLTAAVPGILGRWFRKKPFVFEVRDLWPELPKAMGVIKNPLIIWAMGILEWVSYHSAHRLIALSPGMVEGIVRKGIPKSRITMIPNGCDFDIFGAARSSWRPQCVLDSDFLAIFTGTHGIANGLYAVLDAAAVLRDRGRTDIKLALVGDGKLKPELMARSRDEGLTNVIFHESIDKAKLAALMKGSDIGLQILDNVPAFYEGTSPNKFFDYISAGLPVLINYPGWLARKLAEEKCGLPVPPSDPVAFADALEWAADHRLELKEMGGRARGLAMREFDRQKLANEFVSWLEAASHI